MDSVLQSLGEKVIKNLDESKLPYNTVPTLFFAILVTSAIVILFGLGCFEFARRIWIDWVLDRCLDIRSPVSDNFQIAQCLQVLFMLCCVGLGCIAVLALVVYGRRQKPSRDAVQTSEKTRTKWVKITMPVLIVCAFVFSWQSYSFAEKHYRSRIDIIENNDLSVLSAIEDQLMCHFDCRAESTHCLNCKKVIESYYLSKWYHHTVMYGLLCVFLSVPLALCVKSFRSKFCKGPTKPSVQDAADSAVDGQSDCGNNDDNCNNRQSESDDERVSLFQSGEICRANSIDTVSYVSAKSRL